MFKRFLLFILISLMLAIGSHAYAATNFFGAITLTGGTSGALDDIDGDDLANADICYVVTSTDFYVYYLNATSGAGESSPDIISPDDNAGNKRWELIFLGDAEMADMAQLAVTDGNFIVGNGTTWVAESGNTARTSLGLGTGNSPTFVTNNLTGITDYNIPYMQPAGAGFGDSPLWTDGTDVELGADDSTKHFDVHSAGTIKMRDASDDTLVTIGPVADGTTILGITGSLNPSGDVYIADDKKIYLGSDQDFSMEYDEDGNDNASFDGADINFNPTAGLSQFGTASGVGQVNITPATAIDALFIKTQEAAGATDGIKITDSGDAEIFAVDSDGNVEATSFTADHMVVSTKTDSYVVTSADFGKSLRMNSADDKSFTLPSVGTSEDGARLTFIKQGAGKMTMIAVDTDYIDDSSATGTIYTITNYATVTLEYVHGMTRWVIISASGTFTLT